MLHMLKQFINLCYAGKKLQSPIKIHPGKVQQSPLITIGRQLIRETHKSASNTGARFSYFHMLTINRLNQHFQSLNIYHFKVRCNRMKVYP